MARDKLTEYSATASENTVCGDVNIAENSALPSDLNNYAREIMTHLKNFSDGTDAIDALTVTGNLLVGKTSSSISGAGHVHNSNGVMYHTANGNRPLDLNRETSDGDIAIFRKDGTTVGSIGNRSTALQVQSNGGVGVDLALNNIFPLKSGSLTDDAVTLGDGTRRFKDLYLSGGAYIGGTAAANALDDYEEGTWTPTAVAGITFTGSPSGTYIKVGSMVTVYDSLTCNLTSGADFQIGGLPFAPAGGNEPAILIFNNSSTTAYVPRGRVATGGEIRGRSPATVSGINLMIQATYHV